MALPNAASLLCHIPFDTDLVGTKGFATAATFSGNEPTQDEGHVSTSIGGGYRLTNTNVGEYSNMDLLQTQNTQKSYPAWGLNFWVTPLPLVDQINATSLNLMYFDNFFGIDGFELRITKDTGQLTLAGSSSGSYSFVSDPAAIITYEVPNMITVTRDGNDSVVYINAVEVFRRVGDAYDFVWFQNGYNRLPGTNSNLRAIWDDFSFWTERLDPDAIALLWNGGAGRAAPDIFTIGQLTPVLTQNTALYSLTSQAVQDHNAPYSNVAVSLQHDALWSESAVVLTQHLNPFGDKPFARQQVEALYDSLPVVLTQFESEYGIPYVQKMHTAPYSDTGISVWQVGHHLHSRAGAGITHERTVQFMEEVPTEYAGPVYEVSLSAVTAEPVVETTASPTFYYSPGDFIAANFSTVIPFKTFLHSGTGIILPFKTLLGGRTLKENTLDQQWSLAAFAVERGLYQQWSMSNGTVDFLRTLDQEWEIKAQAEYERVLEQEWGLGQSSRTLDQKWAIPTSRWITGMVTYINDLRAEFGLTTLFTSYLEGEDIATAHARNMANTGIYQHESEGFPEGYRLWTQRVARLEVPYSWGGENITALAANLPNRADLTPEDAFEAFKESGPHLANFIDERPEGADLRLLVGVEFFGDLNQPGFENSDIAYAVLKFIDFELYGATPVMKERTLTQQYSLEGALVEFYGQEWQIDAYTPVRTSHELLFGLRVAQQLSSNWIAKVATSHESAWGTLFSTSHTARYTQSLPVGAGHEAPYADNLRVQGSLESLYGELVGLSAQHEAPFQSSVTLLTLMVSGYEPASTVTAGHEDQWVLRADLIRHHSSPYSDVVPVLAQLASSFDLNVTNQVLRAQSSFYSLMTAQTLISGDQFSVKVGARVLDISPGSLQVSMDEGDFGWHGSFNLEAIEDYLTLDRGTAVTLDLAGELYSMVVESKTLTRRSTTNTIMTIELVSAKAYLNDPRQSESVTHLQTVPITAIALAEFLLGESIDWQVIDWTIPAYRFAVRGVTPVAAARKVVEACGGVLETLPDATIQARYRYPISVPDMLSTTPDHELSDDQDHLSMSAPIPPAEFFNRLRIREAPSESSDVLEFVKDETFPDRGVLRVYLSPWRGNTEVQTTGGAAISLSLIGVVRRQETQLLEFVDGAASTSYPVLSVDDVTWLSSSLGTVGAEPRARKVYAGANEGSGYGLAEVTYTVETIEYRVQFPTGRAAQFILVDRGA